MPYTPNSTWVDGLGGGTPLSAARLNNLESGVTMTYDAHTPAWTSSGSAPSLGDGTAYGRYLQRGKFIHYVGRITFGSTTTFGTGTYSFSLPVTASLTSGNARVLGIVEGGDSSTGNRVVAVAETASAAVFSATYQATHLGLATNIAQTAPWTWASGDEIRWNLIYEAA